jgi:hypothetical protein
VLNEAQLFLLTIPSAGVLGFVAVRLTAWYMMSPKRIENRAFKDMEHLDRLRQEAFEAEFNTSKRPVMTKESSV